MTLSARMHRLIYGDDNHMSLCARAWWQHDVSRFWRLWVLVFGPKHCKESWDWYYGEEKDNGS